jgi:integrase
MARTIKPAAMDSKTARAKLRRGRQPSWNALTARAHLGYQRWPGEPAGRWILRRRIGRRYSTMSVGAADDALAADGVSVLSYHEARQRALELAGAERVAGSPTVGRVFEDYVRDLRARGKSTEVASTAAIYIGEELGPTPVAELTTSMLQAWLAGVAAVSVRHGKPVDGDEAMRRRKNSANRIASSLIAALNHAFREGLASSDAAWRRLKKFRGVDNVRTRYLSIDECVRLLNACDPDFRRLVCAALSTGMRFGELARLTVADFNPDAGVLAVLRSKTNRPRHVVLTTEGAAFFEQICAGRSGDERMLMRDDAEFWRHTNMARAMANAVTRAKISPRISFHGLRHTYASLSIMNGVSLLVIAKNLGHTTTRMVERHYGHMSENYISAEIRRGAPRFGAEPAVNVESLNRGKRRGIV